MDIVRHLILPKNPSQDTPRDTTECGFQAHKMHADYLGKLPCTLEYPCDEKELVKVYTTRTKNKLFLLKPRFD